MKHINLTSWKFKLILVALPTNLQPTQILYIQLVYLTLKAAKPLIIPVTIESNVCCKFLKFKVCVIYLGNKNLMLGPLYYKDRPTYVKEMTLYFSKLTKFEIRHIGLLFRMSSVAIHIDSFLICSAGSVYILSTAPFETQPRFWADHYHFIISRRCTRA